MVQLGERFQLFAPDSTRRERTVHSDLPVFSTDVMLETEDLLPALPVRFHTPVIWKTADDAFALFDAQAGYHVSLEDFDTEARRTKLENLSMTTPYQDIAGHPLVLFSYVEREELERLDLITRVPERWEIDLSDAAAEVLPRLRLQIVAPVGRFIAAPEVSALRSGTLFYNRGFHPFDCGPLAPDPLGRLFEEGLQLALPADASALSQLQAQFMMSGY